VLLELHNIQKRFGGVVALRNGNLDVDSGEVHLLLGENGAGKSTLMKIAAGMLSADGGRILWRGDEVRFGSPKEAVAIGIAMVHQEPLLAPHLSVAENIFLGREPRLPLGLVNRARVREEAERFIESHHFPLKADWQVAKLSPAGKQLVEICRAVRQGSSLLIFDEPTASLSQAETEEVFRIVRALRERGMGVIYITHRLQELRALGDRVTILRDGETIHTAPLEQLSTEQIIHYMVGREMVTIYQREPLLRGGELLRVEGLTRRPLLKNISFTLHAGEIVGLAGLVGAGRTELCRVLFGLDPADSGRIFVDGHEVHIRSPKEAVEAGLALIPEDRQKHGLAPLLPLSHNVTHAALHNISRFGFLNHKAERQVTEEFISRLRIRASFWRQPAGRLSGGNQQKVVIAKWLLRRAKVFLFDEPTRGIDVGAKLEVFQLMDELVRSGAAILMVSSELPELIQVADRVLVMRAGAIVAELPPHPDQEEVMRYAALDNSAP